MVVRVDVQGRVDQVRIDFVRGAKRLWASTRPGHAPATGMETVEEDRAEAHARARIAKPGPSPAKIQLARSVGG